jgi:hypothetical protein
MKKSDGTMVDQLDSMTFLFASQIPTFLASSTLEKFEGVE